IPTCGDQMPQFGSVFLRKLKPTLSLDLRQNTCIRKIFFYFGNILFRFNIRKHHIFQAEFAHGSKISDVFFCQRPLDVERWMNNVDRFARSHKSSWTISEDESISIHGGDADAFIAIREISIDRSLNTNPMT